MFKNTPKAIHQVDRHVGLRIRQRRLQLDMSQTELAELLDLTFQQVQKYEKGSNRVSASRLVQLASVLAVPVSYFFEDAPSGATSRAQTLPNGAASLLTDRIGVRLCAAFLKIERPDLRAAIVKMIEQLPTGPH